MERRYTVYTLCSLLAPAQPQDKDFNMLLAAMRSHFDPKPLVIAERFRFYKRSQSSIAEFAADVRRLSIRCEIGTFLDEAL